MEPNINSTFNSGSNTSCFVISTVADSGGAQPGGRGGTSICMHIGYVQWRTWHTSSGGQAAASIHFSDGGGGGG